MAEGILLEVKKKSFYNQRKTDFLDAKRELRRHIFRLLDILWGD